MKELEKKLQQIDGKGYKAYKDIQGHYQGKNFSLHIDYVQGDPFAAPSRIRLVFPKKTAGIQEEWLESKERKIAFEDFFAREVAKKIQSHSSRYAGSGKSGLIAIDAPGQEILARTSVKADMKLIEFRLSIGLPANGRRVLGKVAKQLLIENIPEIIERALFDFNQDSLIRQIHLADQQVVIREYLKNNGYVAFVANGSILPRESGISNRPLKNGRIIPFQSPPSLEVEIPVPHSQPIKGMVIPKGVSLIVGGGYHGKSTLLKAIERGVYNHVIGDGREYVITDDSAVKIRAEDGRRVESVNISPFISNLPFQKNTVKFSSEDTSGSTSQATNIMEALEMQAKALLIDEDTSATNFMIRDARMQALVYKDKEPITPFIDKVQQLYSDYQVSTILVIGGSGDYFDVADLVILMDEYKPYDVTKEAKTIRDKLQYLRSSEGGTRFGNVTKRIVLRQSFHAYKGKWEKIDGKGLHKIIYGKYDIDLSFVEQLVDQSQTRAIANMIKYISENADDSKSLALLIDDLYQKIEEQEIEIISPYYGKHPGDLALPRKFELAAAINRLRTLMVR